MSRVGLVVGKFCPLHEGHRSLIDFARAHCDHLLIVSYTKPELPGCGVAARQRWLDHLYPDTTRLVVDDDILSALGVKMRIAPCKLPDNDAPDTEHRAFTAWLCQVVLGVVPDVVFTSETYGDGFAHAMTLLTAKARPGLAPVEHICFDLERRRVPVSGTDIRRNPLSYRAFLPDIVAASFVQRIALLGGESSGKTTLAAALANALANALGTLWVAEYGRELWEARRGELTFDDMLAIARIQVEREEAVLTAAHGWLICDTTPLVTAFYSQAMFGAVDPQLTALAARQYHYTFVCAPDFDFVQDGTRRDGVFRGTQHHYYLDALEQRGVPYTILAGSLADRIATAITTLRLTRSTQNALSLNFQ